jgi:hypothetical protein
MSGPGSLAEADGNRTRQRQDLPLSDFEDRAGHQTGYASLAHGPIMAGSLMEAMAYRLTQYAHGGGCACKIPPGELEDVIRALAKAEPRNPVGELLVGLDDGDDAAAVRIEGGTALIATTDFFTPVVDDAYDWGRIAATNALSDVYAMGGRPVVAVNLWVGRATCCRSSWRLKRCAADWMFAATRVAIWRAGTASTTRNPNTGWR